MNPMLVQTRSAEMPVMLRSQVKTMPSLQIVVRKVIQEKASAILRRLDVNIGYVKHLQGHSHERWDGNPPAIYPSQEARSLALACESQQHS